jgi:hypothetical protein
MARRLYTAAQAARAGLDSLQAASLAHSIRWCVSRLHVTTPDRDVVRDACRRMRLAARRRRKPLVLTREARKFVYRVALRCHADNRALYRRVMLGGF